MTRAVKVVLLTLSELWLPRAGYVYDTPDGRRRGRFFTVGLVALLAAVGGFAGGLRTAAIILLAGLITLGILFAVEVRVARRERDRR